MNTDDVSFKDAKKIPPAFAGILTDWSVGSREITATIIDLILRGYIIETEKSLVRTNKTRGLLNFEKEFLDLIFKKKKELSFDQLSAYYKTKIAYTQDEFMKDKFHDTIQIFYDGLEQEKILDKDYKKKVSSAEKMAFGESIAKFINATSRPSKIIQGVLLIIVVILIIYVSPIISPIVPVYAYFGCWIIIMGFLAVWFRSRVKARLGKDYEGILSKKGMIVKEQSLQLKKYMETYPLLEDRLSNEMVAHAVAFGLGKKWTKKLGEKSKFMIFMEENQWKNNALNYFMGWKPGSVQQN